MQFHHFNNTGYWLSSVDKSLLEPIWDEVNSYQHLLPQPRPWGHKLHQDLTTCKDHLARIVNAHLDAYLSTCPYNPLERTEDLFGAVKPLYLRDAWVNFITRGYYEPIHPHSGAVTFVLWLQIPYTYSEEIAYRPNVDHRYNTSGCFGIHTPDAMGRLQHTILPAYNDWEGTLCLFPAGMQHSVFPFFSSEDVRIAVSGNLFYEL